MFPFLLQQTPGPPPPVQSQVMETTVATSMPAQLEALLKGREWVRAAAWFETASPTVRGTYHELWLQCLNRSQQWQRLLEVCESLQPQLEAKSGPHLGTHRLYRAQCLGQLGRHGEAAQAHAENGRLGYPDGYPNACAEARLAGDWAGLLTYAADLLARAPRHPEAQAWKGEALTRMERFAEAEPVLREALAFNAQTAYAWNNLGRCLNERKAWAEACEALDKALVLDPNQIEANFNRGRCLFELRRYRDSRDAFRAALALSPGDPVLAENLRQAERYAAIAPPKPR